jgi:hypothetical protein
MPELPAESHIAGKRKRNATEIAKIILAFRLESIFSALKTGLL